MQKLKFTNVWRGLVLNYGSFYQNAVLYVMTSLTIKWPHFSVKAGYSVVICTISILLIDPI